VLRYILIIYHNEILVRTWDYSILFVLLFKIPVFMAQILYIYKLKHSFYLRGRRGRDQMVVGFTTLSVQSVPITTYVVSSNTVHGKVYSIQHYMIKFVSDLRQVGGFLRVLWFPPPIKLVTGRWFSLGTPVSSTNKTDRYDITEMLLQVALNTRNQPTIYLYFERNKIFLPRESLIFIFKIQGL